MAREKGLIDRAVTVRVGETLEIEAAASRDRLPRAIVDSPQYLGHAAPVTSTEVDDLEEASA